MTAREFCYWLQGYFELDGSGQAGSEGTYAVLGIGAQQVDTIKRHLSLVFKHEIDPSYPNQSALNSLHNSRPTLDSETIIRC